MGLEVGVAERGVRMPIRPTAQAPNRHLNLSTTAVSHLTDNHSIEGRNVYASDRRVVARPYSAGWWLSNRLWKEDSKYEVCLVLAKLGGESDWR